ncbi:uncharacterized protein LOC118198657 [Stegodyphus dumicola]|uniref:uncharacterized protein LOC118198657 n=1 Tax=Stegodyphus dumicola TaxID=202533 RepID=UPI0015AED380|nr:uncharacterized protein LOC118198657 [Stegodyphus dumicola]
MTFTPSVLSTDIDEARLRQLVEEDQYATTRELVKELDVLFEDSDCPFRDSDDDLLDEVDQIFMENPLILPLYYHVGSGFETSSSSAHGPVFIAASNERSIDEAIVLTEKSRRRNHKYQAEKITFRASIDMERLPLNVQGIPIVRIPDTVRELFEQLIRRTTADLSPSDLM